MSSIYILILGVLEYIFVIPIQEKLLKKYFLHENQKETFSSYVMIYQNIIIIENLMILIKVLFKVLQRYQTQLFLHYIIFYAFGTPLLIFSSYYFKDRIFGLWVGYGIIIIIQLLISLFVFIKNVDWEQEIASIRSKNNNEII